MCACIQLLQKCLDSEMADHLAQQVWEHFTDEVLPVNIILYTERTIEQRDDIFSKVARFLLELSNSVPLTEVNSIIIYCYMYIVILNKNT